MCHQHPARQNDNIVATDQFMELYYDSVVSPMEVVFEERCNAIGFASGAMADSLDLYCWRCDQLGVHAPGFNSDRAFAHDSSRVCNTYWPADGADCDCSNK